VTPKRRLQLEQFAALWLANAGNATAAMRAMKPDYTDEVAAVRGSQLLKAAREEGILRDQTEALVAQTTSSGGQLGELVNTPPLRPVEVLGALSGQAQASLADFLTFADEADVEAPATDAERDARQRQIDACGAFVDLRKARRRGKLALLKELSYDGRGLPRIRLVDTDSSLAKLASIYELQSEKNRTPLTQADIWPAIMALIPEDAQAHLMRALQTIQSRRTGVIDITADWS